MAFRIIIICSYLLFFLSTSLSSSLNPPLCDSHDSLSLLQFKNSFSLDHSASIGCDDQFYDYDDYTDNVWFKNSSYPKTASWGNESNCCLWDGITCDSESGHVIGVDLSCSWLQGPFHPNTSLFQLSHLQTLNLAFNDFRGSFISSQFGDLSTLTHLNLSYSSFTGDISPQLAHLSQLESLDLSRYLFFSTEWPWLRVEASTWEKLLLNMTHLRELVLDGVDMSSLPPSSLSLLVNLSSSLVSLRLSDTELQGNITSDILRLKALRQLDLSDNDNLNGQLPKSNWSSPLSFLALRWTHFWGEMLDSIGHLKNLNHLDLSLCHFDGRVPLGLRNLTQLTYLDLSYNKFSGEISFLPNSYHLTYLGLRGNNFFGEIQPEISQFSKLVYLDLSSNFDLKQSPSLRLAPSTWEKLIRNSTDLRTLGLGYVNMSSITADSLSLLTTLSSSLMALSLYGTSLQGDIINVISHLENLKFLALGGNADMKIQLSKLNCSSITSLDLSGTPFSGELPDSIGHLKSLEILDLSDCQLEGHIPPSFKNLTQLTVLDLSSNKFSGGVSFLSTLLNLSSLYLSNNSFSGQVPSSLSDLKHLYSLDLSRNNFSGEIPDVLGKLGELQYLQLNNNHFNGELPDVFGKLGELRNLQLNNNNFSGEVPSSLANTSISFLDLSFNKFQGNLPFPFSGALFFSVSKNQFSGEISSLFCNASSLEILNLSYNNLSGHIPQCLVGLPHISVVDLQMNGFTGTLPNNYSKGNSLETLHFNNNQLIGTLPLSLARCTQLNIFDLGHNKIKDIFPSWLDDLPELQVLVLRENKFYGAISSSNTKHPFPKLRIFDISRNYFHGSLPATYIRKFEGMMKTDKADAGSQYMGSNDSAYKDSLIITWKGFDYEFERILTIYTTIDLSNNMFDGDIPEAIGDLHALIGLNLSHNRITGSIPKSIANLTSLEYLDLSWNKLVGEIPLTMINLNFLSVLNLSQNQLEGKIPIGQQFNTFQKDSYEGNLGLCGPPLSKSCQGESPRTSSMLDFEDRFGFGWKPVAFGYGCGMVFGIFMGYIVFSTGKPQWLVRIFRG